MLAPIRQQAVDSLPYFGDPSRSPSSCLPSTFPSFRGSWGRLVQPPLILQWHQSHRQERQPASIGLRVRHGQAHCSCPMACQCQFSLYPPSTFLSWPGLPTAPPHELPALQRPSPVGPEWLDTPGALYLPRGFPLSFTPTMRSIFLSLAEPSFTPMRLSKAISAALRLPTDLLATTPLPDWWHHIPFRHGLGTTSFGSARINTQLAVSSNQFAVGINETCVRRGAALIIWVLIHHVKSTIVSVITMDTNRVNWCHAWKWRVWNTSFIGVGISHKPVQRKSP